MLYLYILPETTFEKKNANIPSIGNVNVLTRTDWKSANEKPRPCHCEKAKQNSVLLSLLNEK